MTSVPATVACINRLLEQVPELRPICDAHVRDYDEILPHVLLGDVTRYVVEQVRLGEAGPARLIDRILSVLEHCMVLGDQEVTELIAVSFIENLLEYDDVLRSLKGALGPSLQEEIRKRSK